MHKPIEVTPIQMLRYGYINIKNECFSLIDLRKANASRRVSEIRLQAGIVERRTRCSLQMFAQCKPGWSRVGGITSSLDASFSARDVDDLARGKASAALHGRRVVRNRFCRSLRSNHHEGAAGSPAKKC